MLRGGGGKHYKVAPANKKKPVEEAPHKTVSVGLCEERGEGVGAVLPMVGFCYVAKTRS
jgi:hypothetical protein